MRFSVLALDYDGTIARHGGINQEVLGAIKLARIRRIVVVLVTGRILKDLLRHAGNLDMFDAIVAENGAVIQFPGTRYRVLARPPNPLFLEELSKAKIALEVGHCVVGADASAAPLILKIIRKLELPLSLSFNRSRVMVLPQGISKATGLKEALNTMRLSLHNCLGIGDAENDYVLLDSCEAGVAVKWGSSTLREIADEVVEGEGPSAVAAYIRRIVGHPRLPPNRIDRRRILLGHSVSEGHELQIAVHGRTILIAGDPRSGKSWITGLFLEQLILQGYCVCVFDPEGDYGPLEALPGVVVFGGEDPPPRLTGLAKPLRYPDASVVIDLSRLDHAAKIEYLRQALPMVAQLRQTSGQPHWIVVDEAHYFLNRPDYSELIDVELAAYLLVTHRVSHLYPELLKAVEGIIVTQITDPRESESLADLYGAEGCGPDWNSLMANLRVNEAAILRTDRAGEETLQKFNVADRLTPHVRHRSKYLEVPMHEWHGFRFTSNGTQIGKPARTLKEFVSMMTRVSSESLEEHARRHDFSRWVGDVIGDQPLAEDLRKVEETIDVDDGSNLCQKLIEPIRQRYELTGVACGKV